MTSDVQDDPDGAGRSGWRSWLWMLLGFLPVALGCTLAVRQFVPTAVRSPDELALVGFGWPLVWTIQDHSTVTSPASYPTEIRYVEDARGTAVEVPPTETDWAMFLIDSVVVWAMLAAMVLIVVITLRRFSRSRPVIGSPTSVPAAAGNTTNAAG